MNTAYFVENVNFDVIFCPILQINLKEIKNIIVQMIGETKSKILVSYIFFVVYLIKNGIKNEKKQTTILWNKSFILIRFTFNFFDIMIYEMIKPEP